ncbi:vWA domain-containing protein [Roseivivax sp. CAU 1753]
MRASGLVLGLSLCLAAPVVRAAPVCVDDAMIVLDASGSMAGMGFDHPRGSRMVEARAALHATLPGIARHRRIGLVTYGPGSGRFCARVDLFLPPTARAAGAILNRVDQLLPAGATPLTAAVETAVAALGDGPGTVAVVTDGNETCGGAPCALASALARSAPGITIHVIGFRITGEDISAIPTERDARCLAQGSGGRYIEAWDTDQLSEALHELLGCLVLGDLRGPA